MTFPTHRWLRSARRRRASAREEAEQSDQLPLVSDLGPQIGDEADKIRDGLQILDHAGLLMPKGYNIQGDLFQYGYVTTRRGRAAQTDGSLERILSAAAAAAPA